MFINLRFQKDVDTSTHISKRKTEMAIPSNIIILKIVIWWKQTDPIWGETKPYNKFLHETQNKQL